MKLKMTFLALLLGGSAMAQVSLKVTTKRDTLKIEDATRITYSDDLSEQTIHTASGEERKQALNNIWEVILNDTLHNIIDYLMEDEECVIFKMALYSGHSGDGRSGGFMGPLHHYSNFQTEGHQFALFVPTDEGYMFPQPISFLSRRPRVCKFKLKERITGANANPIEAVLYQYNASTGEIGNSFKTESMSNSDIVNEMQQHLLQHTVFFERPEDKVAGIRSGNEYFKTLLGTYIRVNNDSMCVQGAYQMESEAAGHSTYTHSQIVETKQKQNGIIYKVDSPIVYPAQNTYDVLSDDGKFVDDTYLEFFNLCQGLNDDILIRAFQLEQYSGSTLTTLLDNHCIFHTHNGTAVGNILSFFNNHDFTLYVPTNEAIHQAVADGLPTPESIETLYNESADEEGNVSETVRLELRKQVLELLNFIRYHFHFGSEVADQLPFAARTHNTPVVLPETLTTPKLTVSSNGNGTLSVTDAMGNVRHVIDAHKNVFVREVWANKTLDSALNMNGINVQSSSPGVIHLIDGVLRYK